MDQLCINQRDTEERGEEVRKMRNCYGNSSVTLISVNTTAEDKKNINNSEKSKIEFVTEILKKIVNSEWFTRS